MADHSEATWEPRASSACVARGSRFLEGLNASWFAAFLHPDGVIRGKFRSGCTKPLGQRMEARTVPVASPRPKNTSLLCCERNPDPACSMRVCRPDAVSIVMTAPMASRLLLTPRRRKAIDGGSSRIDVLQEPQLRAVAVFEKHFLAAVMIEVGQREGAAILQKIQLHCAGDIGKCSVAIVRVKDIAFVAAPGAVGADQFVDRVPSLFVFVRRLGCRPANCATTCRQKKLFRSSRRTALRKSCRWRCRDRESRHDRNPRRRSTTTSGPCRRPLV